jgi:hypothetical protein
MKVVSSFVRLARRSVQWCMVKYIKKSLTSGTFIQSILGVEEIQRSTREFTF